MSLEPLQDASLCDQAYESIKEAILSLQMSPSEMLGIGELAEKLGVSRTPVRDALMRLESDGLVEIVPYKGARVTDITISDVREIYELRILLEGYAARISTPQLSNVDIKWLELELAQAEQALNKGDEIAAAEFGRSIHNILIEKVKNKRFQSWLESLEVQYARTRRLVGLIPGRPKKSYEEHWVIVRALVDGDAERVAKALEDHLYSVQQDILDNTDLFPDSLKDLPLPSTLVRTGVS